MATNLPDPQFHDQRQPSPLDWAERVGATHGVLLELSRLAQRRRRRRVALGSAMALMLAGGVASWLRWYPEEGDLRIPSPVAATMSQPVRHRLGDGTIIDEKAGAKLKVRFSSEVRRVVLQEGTALFQVTKDAAWPFVVSAAGFEVRAIGTAFSVQVGPTGLEIFVTEGRVSVTPDGTADRVRREARPAFLEAGECVTVAAHGPADHAPAFTVKNLLHEEMAARLAWCIPRLNFSGAPLRDVVGMFNRHNRRQLVIADDSLQNVELSGVLQADNLSGLLNLLRTSFAIEAENRGDHEILLRPMR